MNRELDAVDRKILTVLQDDARTPIAKIAKALKMGETTIRYRINKLEKNGVITRYTALLDPRAVGFDVAAILLVKADHPKIKDVFAALASYAEVQHVIQTTGEHDMVAVAHLKNNEHLNEFARRIRAIRGVKDALVWIATGLVKIETRLPV